MCVRQIADISEIVALDRVRRERLRNLIEHPLIDHPSFALRARVLERDERFAEELPHLAIDLSRPEIAIVQKNLEPRGRFFIVIWKSDRNFGCRLASWRKLGRRSALRNSAHR